MATQIRTDDIAAAQVTAAKVAADVATQAELDAHTGDTSAAHAASAISADSTTLVGVGADVQAVLEELDDSVAAAAVATRNLTAGDGLSGGGDLSADRTFTVNTDGMTIETSADALRVKDGGITVAKLSFDPATQAELDAHTGDTSAAHAASAISADSTTLVGTGTDVQAVLEELDNGVADHLADTSAAHAASAISADSTTLTGTGTDVQAVLEELDNTVDLAVPKALYDANTVLKADSDNTPAALTMGASTILARLAAGNIVAATPAELRTLLALVIGTNVQAWDADLDAVAAVATATFGRSLLALASAVALRNGGGREPNVTVADDPVTAGTSVHIAGDYEIGSGFDTDIGLNAYLEVT